MLPRIAVGLLLLAYAPAAQAQGLRDKITDLFRFGEGCPDPVCIPGGGQHGDHFNPAVRTGGANLILFLADAIGVSASNIPISAASGGALWGRSPEGLPMRTETSAGPIFAERGRTLGRGHVLVGLTVNRFDYRSLRGIPLDGIVTTFTHEDVPPAGLGDPYFENDVIEVRTRLALNLTAVTAVLSYGIADRVDLGVAVPLVRTKLDGTSEAQVISLSGTTGHFFGTAANPLARATASAQGSAVGLGDIAARVKIAALVRPRATVAFLADVRLPTGKEEDFLGAGATTVRGLGIVSLQYGDFAPHLNAGYVKRGGESQSDAILATLGFDHLMARGVTLAADVITEWEVGKSALQFPEPVTLNERVGTASVVRIVRPTNISNRRDHLAVGSLGAKFAASRGFNLVANLLVPLRQGGLQPNLAWTTGLEYSF